MKRFALCLASAATLLAPALVANAQTFPDKLVTVTVPWPAGGPSDFQFRQMQPALQAQLAQPVMIDNVPGAGGSIGVQQVLRARADGHTVLGTSVSNFILAPLSIAAELTPAQRAEWAKLVQPHRHKLVAEIGGAAPELWAAIQKGKEEFAARGGK